MGGNGPSSHHASGVKGEKGAGIALALKAQHGTTEEISNNNEAGTSAGMAVETQAITKQVQVSESQDQGLWYVMVMATRAEAAVSM